MVKRLCCVLILLTASAVSASAGETVFVDNENIQQYRGHLGRWVHFTSSAVLEKRISETGSSDKEVVKINDADFRKRNLAFVPFSAEYIKKLKSKGISREIRHSGKNEFIWPLGSYDFDHISSPFGYRYGRLHAGADIPAVKGTPVVAAMDGKVVFAAYAHGHGKSILIEHRNHFYTRYSHNSVLLVEKGDYVKKGQIISRVGSTGNSTGNHLHFEVRYNNIPLNPLDFLPYRKIKLLRPYRKLRGYKQVNGILQ